MHLSPTHSLEHYIPPDWKVLILHGSLVLIPSDEAIAEALLQGARRHFRGTAERLRCPVNVVLPSRVVKF